MFHLYNKQEAEQAVPYAPYYIQEMYEEIKEPKVTPGEHTDKVLADLALSDAWKVLKKYINDKRARLEEMTREAARADRFDLQATGYRFLIYDQIDAFAQDIISRVENVVKIKKLSDETATTK